ncbi:MAG: SPOR domain-containing protein [Paracoccaceae bacterium]
MKISHIAALVAVAGALGLNGLHAQSTDTSTAPAELPPASFAGSQYVDSQGCVFVRAGVGDDVTWVPRVGRDRRQICGVQPSESSVTAAQAPSPRAATQPPVDVALDTAPLIETSPSAASRKVTVTPKSTGWKKSKKMTSAKSTVVLASAKPKRTTRGTTPAQNARTGEVILVPRGTRVVPKHLYDNRTSARSFKVPRGYSTVWQDGRLNPRRAEQTLEGRARMNLIWTKTVPRRLIDATTGQDMTDTIPVVYPYTDVASQRRAIALSSKNTVQSSGAAVKEPNVSTRSQALDVPSKGKNESIAGRNYVEIGTFGNARSARKSAQTLKKLALPVRIGKYDRDGTTYRLVLVGPFATGEEAQVALGEARDAGFKDAFTRK